MVYVKKKQRKKTKPLRLHIYSANSILIWQEKYLNGKPSNFGGHQQMQVVF